MTTTLTLTRITGPVETPFGGGPVSGRVRFTLTHHDVESGTLIAPVVIEAQIDETGDFAADLWCPEEGEGGYSYQVSLGWWSAVRNSVVWIDIGFVAPGYSALDQALVDLLTPAAPDPTPTDLLAEITAAASSSGANATIAQAAAAEAAALATAYASRAAAALATVTAGVNRISVLHAGTVLTYIRDAGGTALTTAGGVTWAPGDAITSALHYGATGDGSTDDTAAIVAALAGEAGPIFIPYGTFIVSSLSADDLDRLWGPGSVVVGGTVEEISSTPYLADNQPGLSIVRNAWSPTATFAGVEVAKGPFLIDVTRDGGSGSYGWGLINGRVTAAKGAGANDHLFSTWLNLSGAVTGGRGNAYWPGINGPAFNMAGHAWTSGVASAMEVNFGNRWADFNIMTTFTAGPLTVGIMIVPDTLPSADGPNYWSVSGITIASPGVVSATGHNFTENFTVEFDENTGTLPGGITEGVPYWVVNPSGSTFQIAATPGGTPIATTGSFGAGVRLIAYPPSPFGIVYSKSVNGTQIGTLNHVPSDTIQHGGHYAYLKGSNSSAKRPSSIITATLNWLRGFDFSATVFSSGIAALFGASHQLRWVSSTGSLINGTATALNISTGAGTGLGRLLTNNSAHTALTFADSGTEALLSLYGVTPVAQQTVAAVATDLSTALTLLNNIRMLGINLGAWKA